MSNHFDFINKALGPYFFDLIITNPLKIRVIFIQFSYTFFILKSLDSKLFLGPSTEGRKGQFKRDCFVTVL